MFDGLKKTDLVVCQIGLGGPSPGITEAIVTSAPNLVRVSVIAVVSISSESSAIGTKTFFDMARDIEDEK